MDGHSAIAWLQQTLGALLIFSVLLDVFLTVLYARIGSGIFSHALSKLIWCVFRQIGRFFTSQCDMILAFCGPVILVALVAVWGAGLICGGALIIHPKLGDSIIATNGQKTPRDFATALYVAGDSLTTVGTSDLAPRSPWFRIFYMCNSFIGICVITLTLTYLLEIYNALHRRNTLALKLHIAAGETADAADLIAGVGPRGQFAVGYTHLAEIAAEVASAKESHHFYSVLIYFRFREIYYSLARGTLLTLDCVTLIKSALDDREFGWLKESAAVSQLWRGSMHLLTVLAVAFLPGGLPESSQPPDPQTLQRWRERYFAALVRLRQAEIRTIEDEQAGAEVYISLRARWDRYIRAFARYMMHDMENIDPVGSNPARIQQRQEFQTRLRSAG